MCLDMADTVGRAVPAAGLLPRNFGVIGLAGVQEPGGMGHPTGIESARRRLSPFLKCYPGSSSAVSGSQVEKREAPEAARPGKRRQKPMRLLAVRRLLAEDAVGAKILRPARTPAPFDGELVEQILVLGNTGGPTGFGPDIAFIAQQAIAHPARPGAARFGI